jgi:16S rRNA (cytosine1402-N4)-methyltransferase
VPVLIEEVIHALAPVNGAVMVDGTYGGGGYARAALAVADITLIGIDRDPEAMERAWAHAGKDARADPGAGPVRRTRSDRPRWRARTMSTA